MTDPLPLRQKPDPLPAIFPEPEYAVTGEKKRRYEDMKTALQVPWMGVITMAYAHYPTFFDTLWSGLKPLCLSSSYVSASRELRRHIETEITALNPPPITGYLLELGYGPREIDRIRELVEVFTHGNFAYLPIAAIARGLLEGHEMQGRGGVAPFQGRHAPDVAVPFILMERHHADPPTRDVFDDIMATLGLPFVNTDYRGLARWPSYFAKAWGDLKPHIGTPTYAAVTQGMHDRLFETALRQLPNPSGLTSQAVRKAAAKDASVEEVLEMVCLFAWLLPGLMANVAFFRAQLLEQSAA